MTQFPTSFDTGIRAGSNRGDPGRASLSVFLVFRFSKKEKKSWESFESERNAHDREAEMN